MIISKFSIRRQVTLLMFYAIVLSFSFFAFSQLKVDFFPDIQFPIAGVITSYSGVAPQDIENTMTRPLEEAVSSVKNIEQVNSQSFTGTSIITLEFKYGTDMQQAEIDIRKNIDFIRDFLPSDANEPMVFVFDPSMSPIMFISLSSPYLGQSELRTLAEKRIEPLLERISGVASVAVSGGLERQININLDPVRLAGLGLSPNDVAQAVQFARGIQPGGTLETNERTYQLSLLSEYSTVDQVRKTTVAVRGGKAIYVDDVADVVDGFKESSVEVRANYGEGILIILNKQSDANTVQTSDLIYEALPEIQKQLPQGTQFSVVWSQSDFIVQSVNNLRDSAVIAFVLSFLVLYIFLRNFRASIIMGVSMPVSILATFAVLYAFNLTLNIISMAGLALAVGMLVDNSVVVLENIFRRRELGENSADAADNGASQVGMAITASTLTTVAVFVPVLFVPNITGQLFKDMVLTITFSLLVSLIVSLSLVPLMSANMMSNRKNSTTGKYSKFKNKLGSLVDGLTAKYERGLKWSLGRKKTVLGLVFAAFVISIVLAATLGGEFMPKTDQGLINLVVEAPSGNPIEKNRVITYQLEDIVRDVIKPEELESVSLMYGPREGIAAFGTSSSTIEAFIKLKPVKQRSRDQFELSDLMRKRLDKIPGITYLFQEGGSFTTEKAIEIKILGFNTDGALEVANQIKSKLQKVNGFVDISTNIKEATPELQINLDTELLNSFHLSTFQVAANISAAIQGKVVATLRDQGDEYDIRVQFAKSFRNQKESLENVELPLPSGQMVRVGEISRIEQRPSPPTVFRENQSRFVSVGANLSGMDLSAAVAQINSIINSTPIPSEFQVIIGGTAEDQQEAFFYLMLAFIAAILLVYMIMAAQFESFVDPFIIMFTVPLSVIGVFAFLFITGTSLSVMALVGLVMLVGIAVNNGIVMVDFINQLKHGGMELYEAVEKGSVARLRPVLMTALTTILGMVPLALEMGAGSETWSPLARAVIGGLTTTTILTLFVIPILYIVFERMGERAKYYFQKRRTAGTD